MSELKSLIVAGDLDAALEHARYLTPRRVWALLFSEAADALEQPEPFAEFFQIWYGSEESPFVRAEMASWFDQMYLGELAPVEGAEHIGARMATSSKREVLEHVASLIEEHPMSVWSTHPVEPLPREHLEQWLGIARTLRSLEFPPDVDIPEP